MHAPSDVHWNSLSLHFLAWWDWWWYEWFVFFLWSNDFKCDSTLGWTLLHLMWIFYVQFFLWHIYKMKWKESKRKNYFKWDENSSIIATKKLLFKLIFFVALAKSDEWESKQDEINFQKYKIKKFCSCWLSHFFLWEFFTIKNNKMKMIEKFPHNQCFFFFHHIKV